jgi:hypothetical protein
MLRLLSDDDVLMKLAEIAAHDPRAAALAEEVFRRRRDQGGDVAGWVDQIEKARLSILGVFGGTRLAYIAADELGIRLEPEPMESEEAPPTEPPATARQRPSLQGDDPLGEPARPRRRLLE